MFCLTFGVQFNQVVFFTSCTLPQYSLQSKPQVTKRNQHHCTQNAPAYIITIEPRALKEERFVDRTDELICEMIRDNARISYKELGDAIRMSRMAAKKRVQKLEREGVIRGYHACIYLEDEVTMLINIETAPGKMENVIRVLTNRMAYIREIFRTTCGNHVHIVAVSEDSANLGYLIKMIKKNCGNDIVSIDSRIVKEVIKDN